MSAIRPSTLHASIPRTVAGARLEPGERAPGLTLGGVCYSRGQIITIDQEMLDLGTDRFGNSVYDLFDDLETQFRRWGRIAIVRGVEELEPEPGSPEEDEARDAARARAWAEEDPTVRAAILKVAERKYDKRSTQRTLWEG